MPTAVDIERRTAITVAGLLLGAPSLALAQKADRKLHIGILVGDTPSPGEEQALLEGLREQGFVEGHSLSIESSWADGRVHQADHRARHRDAGVGGAAVEAGAGEGRGWQAARQRLPAFCGLPEFVDTGGLISYAIAGPGPSAAWQTLSPGSQRAQDPATCRSLNRRCSNR